MKTITNLNNLSLYLFDDDEYLNIADNYTNVGMPVKMQIADCNITNVRLFSKATPPADWTGGKYFYDGATWALNPDYVELIKNQPIGLIEKLSTLLGVK